MAATALVKNRATPAESTHVPQTGKKASRWWELATITFNEWLEDKGPTLGAALAYYTVFSLAPVLVISIAMAEAIFDPKTVAQHVYNQLQGMLGDEGAKGVSQLIYNAQQQEHGGVAGMFGLVALLLGATGVFGQLKESLNMIWNVEPPPSSGVWAFVKDRFLSFAMVLGVGFLLLVLLVVSAAISAMQKWFHGLIPMPGLVTHALDIVVTFGIVTLLFAMIFRVLPDTEIDWQDVWLGAAATAVMFTLGKIAIGLYLGRASVGSAYGAAGTIVIVLLWAYYSSQILLLGAEFTQVYARSYGSHVTDKAAPSKTSPQEPQLEVSGPWPSSDAAP